MRPIDNIAELDPPTAPFKPGPAGTHITIRGLSKYYAGWPLYENFDLDIPKRSIVSVFGPNGCGKSTLINMIAGLVPIDAGQILFDGKSLADTKIGYVFQNYREAMFPWMRTIDNIAYPLKLEGRSKAEVVRVLSFSSPEYSRPKFQFEIARSDVSDCTSYARVYV